MKALYYIIVVLFITGCDPEQTVTFKVNNQTQYNTEMTLYSKGVVNKSFQIKKSTSVVIYTDSGLSPESFQTNDYDSIRFIFENNKFLVFVNDTVNSPNDIYNGDNWRVETKKHTQIFTYTLDNKLIE